MQIKGMKGHMIQGWIAPVFLAGLAAGILAMHMGKGILMENTGLFDADTLCRMKYMTVDVNALFSYVLRERMMKILGLAVLATTYLGFAACIASAAWWGISMGAFLSALAVRYGLKGIFLSAVCLFPQYLLYVPAFLALLGWCETLYRGIYQRRIDTGDKTYLPKKLAKLAAIFLIAALGCFLEAYVNPALLLKYLRIF